MKNKKTKTIEKTKNATIDIHEKNREIEITRLLTMLKNATMRHEKCRIRNRLRKLNHFGALRNRTYFDKSTKQTIIVEKSKKNA